MFFESIISFLFLHLTIVYTIVLSRNSTAKINACIFVLARNEDLIDLVNTIKRLESIFNQKYNYPYVILNNVPFTALFKNEILKHTQSLVEFGQIAKNEWSLPKWINKKRFNYLLNTSHQHVYKANLVSYHHMCRYLSGFFFRHGLTLKYDYYWRIDPHLTFTCEFKEDPFRTLYDNDKLYGFALALHEIPDTIPSLWYTIQKWLIQSGYTTNKKNALNFISDDQGKTINLCHFWNNFEIASFSIFRTESYLNYFNYLDQSGGIYYERWGDAMIHTFYVSLMLRQDQIHRFENIGYGHIDNFNWPINRRIKCVNKTSANSGSHYCTRYWDYLSKPDDKNMIFYLSIYF
jgi:alpha 1,2-mannosyltransferase